jgi:hypothetical protein
MNLRPSPFCKTTGFVFKNNSLLEQGATNSVSLGKILVFLGLRARRNLRRDLVIAKTTGRCNALKESLRLAHKQAKHCASCSKVFSKKTFCNLDNVGDDDATMHVNWKIFEYNSVKTLGRSH